MRFKRILVLLMAILLLFASGCSANEQTSTLPDVTEYGGKVSIYMKERDSLFYPTLTGEIKLSYLPNKLAVMVAGREFEIDVKTVNRQGELYILSFNQEISLGQLSKQDYLIDLYVYVKDVIVIIPKFGVFKCDDFYEGANLCDDVTGEVRSGLDKSSNYTGWY